MFRENYNTTLSTNYRYKLPDKLYNVKTMRLSAIEYANSSYLISDYKKNNYIKIITNNNNIINEYLLIISDGNYDNNTFTSYINNNFLNQSGTSNDLQYINYSIDIINFKSMFKTINPPVGFTFSLIFFIDDIYINCKNKNISKKKTLGWLLGFREIKYEFTDTIIESESLFDGAGIKYFYFCVDDFTNNDYILNLICLESNCVEKNILAKIPIFNGKLAFSIDNNLLDYYFKRIYNGPVDISVLNISLLDEYGDIIEDNSIDYSFTLEFEVI